MIDEKVEELQSRVLDLKEKMKGFKIERGLKYTYFLGATGSGKSTAINYLMSGHTL